MNRKVYLFLSFFIPRAFKLYIHKSIFLYFFRLHQEKRLFKKSVQGGDQSKFREASIAANFLPEKSGFYIDIGAGGPVLASNSFLFYQRGFRGITIDPISHNERLHKRLRPRDKFLKIIVGLNKGLTNFFEFTPYGYSTTNPDAAAELFKKEGVFLLERGVREQLPLSAIAPFARPEDATLLSVDAEGSDLEILMSNDFKIFAPRVIICEDYNIYLNNSPSAAIDDYLTSFDYRLVEISGYSKIFVHETYLRKTSFQQ